METSVSKASRPLEGLLVLTLEQAVAAPYCSCRLADAGARVIKIERAEGDFARGYDDAVLGLSSYFVWLNRGKESLVVDIKKPDDAALMHRILAKADVFIQNLAPGAAARAGFGSDTLRRKYPRLITMDISGYGAGHTYADMKAYDLLVQAESGLASITGHPAGPGRVGVSVCDIACGMYAHAAILEALIERETSGRGQGLQTSLFESVADWMNVPLLYFEGTGRAPQRIGLAHPSICPYGAFATLDGDLVLISVQNEREWASFCLSVLNAPHLATAEGFGSNNARVANRVDVDVRVAAAFAALTRDQARAALDEAQTAYAFVNGLGDVARHPALRRLSIKTPGGVASIIAPPVRRDGLPPDLGSVPAIGEHTVTLRREFAA